MKGKNGEHPYGDSGQLILLVLFLLIWLLDSFLLQISTFLSDYVSLYIRLIVFLLILVTAVCFIRAGHVVVKHEQRPQGVVYTGAFRYVRHPLYLGSMMFYIGLSVLTASLFSFVMVVPIFIFYNHIAGYEEKLLEDRFRSQPNRKRNSEKADIEDRIMNIACRSIEFCLFYKKRLSEHTPPKRLRRPRAIPYFDILRFDIRYSAVRF